VGDLLMSLIYTCQLNRANPFDYLTQLQRHADQLATSPQLWMPWNYREVMALALTSRAAPYESGPQCSDNCRCKGERWRLGWRGTQADDRASSGEAVLMPTRSESPAAVSGTPSKLVQLVRKRLRQLRRATLALSIGLAVAAGALAIQCR
jgi:hypothetical protein